MRPTTPTQPKSIVPVILSGTLNDAIRDIDTDSMIDFVSLERRIGYDGLLLLLQVARQYIASIKEKIRAEGHYLPEYACARVHVVELERYLNQRES